MRAEQFLVGHDTLGRRAEQQAVVGRACRVAPQPLSSRIEPKSRLKRVVAVFHLKPPLFALATREGQRILRKLANAMR